MEKMEVKKIGRNKEATPSTKRKRHRTAYIPGSTLTPADKKSIEIFSSKILNANIMASTSNGKEQWLIEELKGRYKVIYPKDNKGYFFLLPESKGYLYKIKRGTNELLGIQKVHYRAKARDIASNRHKNNYHFLLRKRSDPSCHSFCDFNTKNIFSFAIFKKVRKVVWATWNKRFDIFQISRDKSQEGEEEMQRKRLVYCTQSNKVVIFLTREDEDLKPKVQELATIEELLEKYHEVLYETNYFERCENGNCYQIYKDLRELEKDGIHDVNELEFTYYSGYLSRDLVKNKVVCLDSKTKLRAFLEDKRIQVDPHIVFGHSWIKITMLDLGSEEKSLKIEFTMKRRFWIYIIKFKVDYLTKKIEFIRENGEIFVEAIKGKSEGDCFELTYYQDRNIVLVDRLRNVGERSKDFFPKSYFFLKKDRSLEELFQAKDNWSVLSYDNQSKQVKCVVEGSKEIVEVTGTVGSQN